jgi:cellulose synthase/poly-beta-1,6-N-acetylglucosamine synthase-like glycosyltransferase
MEIIFWFLIASIIFIYGGYGLFLFLFITNKKKPDLDTELLKKEDPPTVSLIIAAYNEEDFIREKIENSMSLRYPENRLKIMVVSDGSTDQTTSIVKKFANVESLFQPERRGKIHAISRAMTKNNSDLTIFTDANCILNKNAIWNIVKHFEDKKVGAVSGEKRIRINKTSKSNAHGEGLYWKIESFLKKIDYSFYSVVGAAGELFAIRTNLYEPIEEDSILDDFMITLNINIKGFRTAYAPDAYAIENASSKIEEEFKRKVRIASGGFQSVQRLFRRINPFLLPKFAFLFYVHRVSRWYFAPFALIGIFMTNLYLVINGDLIYTILFLLQMLFYLLAYCGHVLRNYRQSIIKVSLVPYYFIFMHLAVLKGLWIYMRNQQSVKWERAKREVSSPSKVDPSVSTI